MGSRVRWEELLEFQEKLGMSWRGRGSQIQGWENPKSRDIGNLGWEQDSLQGSQRNPWMRTPNPGIPNPKWHPDPPVIPSSSGQSQLSPRNSPLPLFLGSIPIPPFPGGKAAGIPAGSANSLMNIPEPPEPRDPPSSPGIPSGHFSNPPPPGVFSSWKSHQK